ncbi:hypothetical protein NE237_018369 [Protea cynaroides]|uniref:Uncharacterized protein n=1 Tax=Protea cynaroides TaxID=273540 RepID=A0A9Q0QNV5_9MAGN|nr:hypothetical protein NE237_018369 [Protea cynaroides]
MPVGWCWRWQWRNVIVDGGIGKVFLGMEAALAAKLYILPLHLNNVELDKVLEVKIKKHNISEEGLIIRGQVPSLKISRVAVETGLAAKLYILPLPLNNVELDKVLEVKINKHNTSEEGLIIRGQAPSLKISRVVEKLTSGEAAKLSEVPRIISVYEDRNEFQLLTTRSPRFLGLDLNYGIWPETVMGKMW